MPTTPARKRSLAAVVAIPLTVALALGVGLGACGNGTDKTPREVVMGAAATTSAAKSSKLDMRVIVSGVSESPDMTISGTGAFDYEANRGRMTMTVPTGTTSMSLEVITIGTVMYEKLPDIASQGLGAKPWLKIDLEQLGKLAGFDVSTLASSQSSNPSQALEFLRGASVDVKEAGKEEVKGANTTHYVFTVDMAKAAANAPAAQKKALDQLAEMYNGQQPKVDAWIDDDGRLRKMTYGVDMSKIKLPAEALANLGGKAPTGLITTTIQLYDFGTSVTAEPPPADQVTDFVDLMSSLNKSSSGSMSSSGSSTGSAP